MYEDICGSAADFLASLMCAPYSYSMYTVSLYIQGEPNKAMSLLLLTSNFCLNALSDAISVREPFFRQYVI